MKKIVISTLLVLSSLQANEATTKSSVKESNSASGIYIGLGIASSAFNGSYFSNTYIVDPNEDILYQNDARRIYSNNTGYKIYGGYQFNKIVGVELSYNDYGSFENTIRLFNKTLNYTQDPSSVSLSANLGYNFLNNQLRPFGIIGMGYMQTNQNTAIFDSEDMAMHYGGGVEYYPTILQGLGFRAGVEFDTLMVGQQRYNDEQNSYSEQVIFRDYANYYASIAYKF